MGQRGEQSVDVEALVAELEREAAGLREKLGPGSVAPPETGTARPPAPAEPAGGSGALLLRNLPAALERLRALADPRGGAVESHRGLLAGPVLALKRVLIRLLTPIWDQQTTFDRALVDQLGELAESIAVTEERLEKRLDTLDRRIVGVEDALARMSDGPATSEVGFDYERFEAAFRGDPERVREKQSQYLRYFPDPKSGPVLDLGCGDGTFLTLLRDAGVEARGVDQSAGAVERARAAGLDVREGDLVAALEACPDGSLGGVVSMQVVEHLSLPLVIHLLRVAKRKLRPGGVFLAETVNVASLLTFARSWTIDPTHRQALHPLTLRFLVDEAGFSASELVYSGDVEPEHVMAIPEGDEAGARNAAILNKLVFGPMDYAVVGRA